MASRSIFRLELEEKNLLTVSMMALDTNCWSRRLYLELLQSSFVSFHDIRMSKLSEYSQCKNVKNIRMSPNHLLFPSTMFSSVLRTFSKSCLLDSLRSSIAGKIRERKITTCNKKSGWKGLTEKVGENKRRKKKEHQCSTCSLVAGGLRVRSAR